MARYEIEFRKSVDKDVREILANDLRKILLKMDALRDDPRPPGSVKLAGDEHYGSGRGIVGSFTKFRKRNYLLR